MSHMELDRLTIISQAYDRQIKQREAAERLRISERQVRRLLHRYRYQGAQGLVSKHKGRVSPRRIPEARKREVKDIVHQHYPDFHPTFAMEKLKEVHDISLRKETVRKWMIEWGLWKHKQRRRLKVHQSRERRQCYGELIQIDGSYHDWFEGRRPACCLHVLIDDATSRLVRLQFEEQETTRGYFHAISEYIQREGRPLALYSDKASIFRNNQGDQHQDSETQFKRAMRQLDIELIYANSPQAKGRVERANGTLQQRLVGELRLQGIDTIEAANAYLTTYMQDYNRRFAVASKKPDNAHRQEIPDASSLAHILSFHSERKLTKNLELSYHNQCYQIQPPGMGIGYGLRHARVTVSESLTGEIQIMHKQRRLAYTKHEGPIGSSAATSRQGVNRKVDQLCQRKRYKPSADHPWNRGFSSRQRKQSAYAS